MSAGDTSSPPLLLALTIKHGPAEHRLSIAAGASVAALKAALEGPTGLAPRQQKLIHKGKVLEDRQALASCKVADGAKLMLLGQQGPSLAGRGGTAAAANAKRLPVGGSSSSGSSAARSGAGSSSSLLAAKVADMAAKQQASAATNSGSSSSSSSVPGLSERRAAWSKTGIVALRDLQLTAIEPAWLEGLTEARSADLSHNRLTALPGSVRSLTSLAALRVTHNALSDAGMPWPQLCAGLAASLASLQLGHNQLQCVPACLSQLTALTRLGLESNALQQIEPAAFDGLSRLEVLSLQGNSLQELPDSLRACSSLVALNASHNALAALPDGITQLTKLQVLMVDANKLRALPAQLLSGCSSLSTLGAHHNPITVEDLRGAEGYAEYEARRQARASKQLGGRVMADSDRAFSEGADVQQWQRWVSGPTGLGSDGTGRAGRK